MKNFKDIKRTLIEKDQIIAELIKENQYLKAQLNGESSKMIFISLNNGRDVYCSFDDEQTADIVMEKIFKARDHEKIKIECKSGIFNLKGKSIETAYVIK